MIPSLFFSFFSQGSPAEIETQDRMVIIFVTLGTNFLLPPFLYSKASLPSSSCSPCTNKKILMYSLCKILSFVTFAKSAPKGLARLNKLTNKLRCQPRALLANWACTIALSPKLPLHTWDTPRWDCRGVVCPGKLNPFRQLPARQTIPFVKAGTITQAILPFVSREIDSAFL